MQNRKIRLVVLFGAISIISIIISQVFFISREWQNQEQKFNQRVTLALKNVAIKIHELNNTQATTHNPVYQYNKHYYIIDLNTEVDNSIIEHFLKQEFTKNNINSDFEYAVYDCINDKMEYGAFFNSDGNKTNHKSTSELPKYDAYELYFGVNFLHYRNIIFKNTYIWFLFLILVLVVIVFFIYSIWIILQQKRLSELQKDFINNMTHEFKTPISGIILASDVLLDSDKRQKMTDLQVSTYTNIINQEAKRLKDQVDTILQISQLEKSIIQLKLQKINLNDLVCDVAQTFKNTLNPNLTFNLDENITEIDADLVHTKNIIFNLIDNALKYAGENAKIEVKTEILGNSKIISVKDDGPGVPKEFHKMIFNKFFRITTNAQKARGYGLGLFYVKTLCDAHQWKIVYEDNIPNGACFKIIIPS